jgi:hypothetical protein
MTDQATVLSANAAPVVLIGNARVVPAILALAAKKAVDARHKAHKAGHDEVVGWEILYTSGT